MSHQQFVRMTQRRDRLLPRDSREVVQELLKRLSRTEIVEKSVDWHSGPDENGRATKDLRVTVNNGSDFGCGHGHTSRLDSTIASLRRHPRMGNDAVASPTETRRGSHLDELPAFDREVFIPYPASFLRTSTSAETSSRLHTSRSPRSTFR